MVVAVLVVEAELVLMLVVVAAVLMARAVPVLVVLGVAVLVVKAEPVLVVVAAVLVLKKAKPVSVLVVGDPDEASVMSAAVDVELAAPVICAADSMGMASQHSSDSDRHKAE